MNQQSNVEVSEGFKGLKRLGSNLDSFPEEEADSSPSLSFLLLKNGDWFEMPARQILEMAPTKICHFPIALCFKLEAGEIYATASHFVFEKLQSEGKPTMSLLQLFEGPAKGLTDMGFLNSEIIYDWPLGKIFALQVSLKMIAWAKPISSEKFFLN